LATVDAYRRYLDTLDDAYPALEWGLRWCELHAPRDSRLLLLPHDYRTGNYLASEQGWRRYWTGSSPAGATLTRTWAGSPPLLAFHPP
jgi:hypothetical protein